MTIEVADLDDPQIVALVAFHYSEMQRHSPPEMCFPLDLEGLRDPRVTVLSLRHQGQVAAIGAIKRLDGDRAEIKSMRTHPDFLRRGLAARMLEAIQTIATQEGFRILSLETGSGPEFEPALALYRSRGFKNGEPFANYSNTDFNQCLHLMLADRPA